MFKKAFIFCVLLFTFLTDSPGNYGRNIYIADKSVKSCRDLGFGLLLRKNMAPREIQNPTLAGAKKKGGREGNV